MRLEKEQGIRVRAGRAAATGTHSFVKDVIGGEGATDFGDESAE